MAHDKDNLGQLADVPPAEHRRRDRIAWGQVWLPAVALAAVGLWSAWYWLWGAESRYMPGPVARVHATWENRCSTCHITSEPLSGGNWTVFLAHDAHAGDAQCQSCHGGPAHHAKEIPGETPGCTTCHREHRGREVELKRVASARCLTCHRGLKDHIQNGTETAYLNVTGFEGDGHPEFAIFRGPGKDPGHVAFNHKLHLAPGLCEQADSNVPFTYVDMPSEFRDRYRPAGRSDQAAVQLECAACHRPDTAGASMLPINYEQHCQACHPLSFAVKSAGNAATVPHHLQPSEAVAWLRGYFSERLAKEDIGVLALPARPLPGKNPEREAAARKLGDALQAKIDAAQRILLGPATCGKCHAALRPELGAGQRIEPADIPSIWFTHARFDHTAHRGLACQHCHAGADASRSHADVLVPRIDVCRSCHAPPGRTAGVAIGGARHDCVECHRYHDGDHPHAGRGAESRRPPQGALTDVQRFLKGKVLR